MIELSLLVSCLLMTYWCLQEQILVQFPRLWAPVTSSLNHLESTTEKSCVYFSGTSRSCPNECWYITFKYLGVPLAAKKLSFTQCKPLIDRITARAQGWIPHFLSYAGRYNWWLGSMLNYWDQIFPLPKKLIKAVENICRKFLWTGSNWQQL